jgi:hypothetical protein
MSTLIILDQIVNVTTGQHIGTVESDSWLLKFNAEGALVCNLNIVLPIAFGYSSTKCKWKEILLKLL